VLGSVVPPFFPPTTHPPRQAARRCRRTSDRVAAPLWSRAAAAKAGAEAKAEDGTSTSGDPSEGEASTSSRGQGQGQEGQEGPDWRDELKEKARATGLGDKVPTAEGARRFLSAALREIRAVLTPADPAGAVVGADRAAADNAAAEAAAATGPSALVAAEGARPGARPPSRWQRALREAGARAQSAAQASPAARAAGEWVSRRGEDLREKWETSDSEFVHRLQDGLEDLSTDSAEAACMREVRARDPAFDMPRFLRGLKPTVARFERAAARGDEAALAELCDPELVGRLMDRARAAAAADVRPDDRVLSTEDVELVAAELDASGDPAIVVDVRVQRVRCARDKHGNVVDGSADQIATLFYFWELRQARGGRQDPVTGAWLPPAWTVTDHVQRPEVLLLTV